MKHNCFAVSTVLMTFAAAPLSAQVAPAKPASGLVLLTGSVIDSIHNTPLAHATVTVDGTSRSAVTNVEGEYRIDSIPPGNHRVIVTHPMLDTIGHPIVTREFSFAANEARPLELSTVSGTSLSIALCPAAWRDKFGPAVMVGFVRDPDTNGPAKGATVEVVFTGTDIIGRKQPPTSRKASVDSVGQYHICGLPADMSGKVQVFRNGVSSGEVPVEVKDNIAIRAFSVAAHQIVAEVKNDSGKVKRYATGSARVTGKVVDKRGQPLRDARVMLQGGGVMAHTKPNGEFVLDSLPSGTQALTVRKLGYGAEEVAVELSSTTPLTTTITLGDAVPVLATVRVEAAQDKALSDIGYLQRKQGAIGHFYDGNQINHESISFSDVMRIDPSLRISPSGDGRTYVITDSRSASNGCVNYYVDNSPWPSMSPGDIDNVIQPSEIVAIEVYHGSETPPQYTTPGQSGCATIVVWTVARVRPRKASSPRKP